MSGLPCVVELMPFHTRVCFHGMLTGFRAVGPKILRVKIRTLIRCKIIKKSFFLINYFTQCLKLFGWPGREGTARGTRFGSEIYKDIRPSARTLKP